MSDVQSDMIERRNLLFAVFGSNLRRATFTFFLILLQLDRLQLTAVYCDRREVQRQHLTRPFSQCESLQGIRIQVRN